MNYSTLNKQEIEENIEKQLDFDETHRERRNQQIIEAKLKARHNKRIEQRKEKREQEKQQKIYDAISIQLLKEKLQKDAEALEL